MEGTLSPEFPDPNPLTDFARLKRRKMSLRDCFELVYHCDKVGKTSGSFEIDGKIAFYDARYVRDQRERVCASENQSAYAEFCMSKNRGENGSEISLSQLPWFDQAIHEYSVLHPDSLNAKHLNKHFLYDTRKAVLEPALDEGDVPVIDEAMMNAATLGTILELQGSRKMFQKILEKFGFVIGDLSRFGVTAEDLDLINQFTQLIQDESLTSPGPDSEGRCGLFSAKQDPIFQTTVRNRNGKSKLNQQISAGDGLRRELKFTGIYEHFEELSSLETGSREAKKQRQRQFEKVHKFWPVVQKMYGSVISLHPSTKMSVVNQLSNMASVSLIQSLPSCAIQMRHIDDDMPGLGALQGLVEDQYVVIYLNSYKLVKEINICARDYDQAMSRKPKGVTNDTFWNFLMKVHLERKGFTSEHKPRPVRVPLRQGFLCVFHFFTIHSGMGASEDGTKSHFRLHFYAANMARGNGYLPHNHTSHLSSDVTLFPAWVFTK